MFSHFGAKWVCLMELMGFKPAPLHAFRANAAPCRLDHSSVLVEASTIKITKKQLRFLIKEASEEQFHLKRMKFLEYLQEAKSLAEELYEMAHDIGDNLDFDFDRDSWNETASMWSSVEFDLNEIRELINRSAKIRGEN